MYVYSMAERFVDNINGARHHIYRGEKHPGKFATKVIYIERGYGRTSCTVYMLYSTASA